MSRSRTIIIGCALAAAALVPLGAQGEEPTGLPEGLWRVVPLEADGVGGTVRFEGGRYERTAGGAPERGDARRMADPRFVLLTPADADGLAQKFGGSGAKGPPTWARYQRSPGGDGWQGFRVVDGKPRRERLERWSDRLDGNAIDLLIDGEAFRSMRPAIDAAQQLIEVQTFQWGDDATGRGIAQQLMAKARAGVKVRCLIDASSKTVNDLIKRKDVSAGLDEEMRAAGVEVIFQHGYGQSFLGSMKNVGRGLWDGVKRLFGGRPPAREKRGVFNHDHRKTLIVDGRVGFAGGMNIAKEYEHDWHDVQAKVTGPAAHELHRLFVDRWRAAGGQATELPAPRWEAPPGDVRVEVLATVPGKDRCILDRYMKEIESAKRTTLIEVAYFLDDRIIDALGRSARRGVRTVVIIPSDEVNDVYLVKEAFAWVKNDVVRSGVELYMFKERLNHSKVAAWDGQRCTVGSSNLDRLALDEISECNLWVPDARFTRQLEQRVFAVDLPKSERQKVEPMAFKRKLVSGPLHFFRRFL